VDNADTADKLNSDCLAASIKLNVFIDLNVGMNRTGIRPEKAFQLFAHCRQLGALIPVGLHVYDGHISDSDITIRQQKSDLAYADVLSLIAGLKNEWNIDPIIIVGGSPSFATHLVRSRVELSPGTFVFWDWGYRQKLPGEPYHFAALVITRIISIVDEHTVCTDLGHKSVAAENPLPRVHFLNAPDAIPVSQSEEHLVVQVPNASEYVVGDVLYGVPVHICPTVALYEKAVVIEQHKAAGEWLVIARNRKITI
jgi:D-serine deaminase-like pyridoxal phosphate-dependent protein